MRFDGYERWTAQELHDELEIVLREKDAARINTDELCGALMVLCRRVDELGERLHAVEATVGSRGPLKESTRQAPPAKAGGLYKDVSGE